MPHFGNVARGVIDLRDVVYFVALAAAFLSLAHWLLLRDRLSHGSRLYRNLRLGTLTIVGIGTSRALHVSPMDETTSLAYSWTL